MTNILSLLTTICGVVCARGFWIKRRINHSRWTTMPDSFTVPPSLCQDDGFSQCTAMGGRHIAQCTCECTETSTFGFYYNQWRCTDNTQVRKHADWCSLKVLSKRQNDTTLFTVPVNPGATVEYYAPNLDPTKCGLYTNSEYMRCNGTWAQIEHDVVTVNFYVGNVDSKAYLGLSNKDPPMHIRGRIIKLYITCYENNEESTHCIFVKVEGSQNCSSMIPSHPPPSSSPTTAEQRTVVSMSQTRHPKPTKQTLAPTVKNTKSSSNTADHSDLIAGATGGSAALIVLVIVIIIIILLRTRRKRKNVRKNTVVVENEGYMADNAPQSHNGEDYAYAYSHAPISKSRHPRESQRSATNGVYDTCTKDTNNQDSQASAQPIYSTLEEPQYTNTPEQRNEVFYHTLEGPTDVSTNELEDQHSNDVPLYNELERPVSYNSPVYKALEGHPHVYMVP